MKVAPLFSNYLQSLRKESVTFMLHIAVILSIRFFQIDCNMVVIYVLHSAFVIGDPFVTNSHHYLPQSQSLPNLPSSTPPIHSPPATYWNKTHPSASPTHPTITDPSLTPPLLTHPSSHSILHTHPSLNHLSPHAILPTPFSLTHPSPHPILPTPFSLTHPSPYPIFPNSPSFARPSPHSPHPTLTDPSLTPPSHHSYYPSIPHIRCTQ